MVEGVEEGLPSRGGGALLGRLHCCDLCTWPACTHGEAASLHFDILLLSLLSPFLPTFSLSQGIHWASLRQRGEDTFHLGAACHCTTL